MASPPSLAGRLCGRVPSCFITVFILLLPVRSLHIRANVFFSLVIHFSTFAFFLYCSINLVHTRLELFQSLTLFPLSFSYGLILVRTSIKMHSLALAVAVVLLSALHLVNGRTYTDCNPLSSSRHMFFHPARGSAYHL
jgi:hypothetical protein